MLKRSKAWRRNQQGTVLLTVVIMVMVLFTLTSICLDVIHHSTRVSSRNVQKTQAKLTAEKVLTEFIEGYKSGKKAADPSLTDETAFADLKAAASGKKQNSPLIYEVKMRNASSGAIQSDFDHNFGHTEIHIYETGKGFNVESICTYSTQTQSATCVFEGTVSTPYVPSNTIESQKGKLIADKQLSNGASGSVWIEKGVGDNGYKKLSRIGNEAHFFVEHNVRCDDAWTTVDVENHIPLESYDASVGGKVKNVEYNVPGYGFSQAPTITVEGYFAFNNDKNGIYTTVGKTDANKNNPKIGAANGYDKDNLGNYDGYVRVDKKLLVNSGKNFKIGNSTNDIDLYAHGLVVGAFPDGNIEGAHDFHAEAEEVKKIYGTLQAQKNDTMEVYGNVYIYKGANETTQDGSIALVNTPLVVHGDIFCEGNIYLLGNISTITCNNLYCSGRIYYDSTDYGPDGNGFTTISTDKNSWWTVDDSGKFYKNGTGSADASSAAKGKITATSIKKTIDTSVQRNKFPEEGFDPQTGKTSASRPDLESIYGPCSANDMFTMTVEDGAVKDKNLKDAADKLSGKYADAMKHTFSIDFSSGDVTSDTYYDNKEKKNKPVAEKIGKTGDDIFVKINSSVKLDTSTANYAGKNAILGYVIELKDEDIVICMPTGCIGAKFRVDASGRTSHTNPSDDAFVYFMFYDPDKMAGDTYTNSDGDEVELDYDGCLYYSGTSATLTGTNSSTSSYAIQGVGKLDKDSTGSGTGAIWFGRQDKKHDGTLFGDIEVVDKNNTSTTDLDQLQKNFSHMGFNNTSKQMNTIMVLIPNDVGFAFNTAEADSTTDFDTWGGGGSGAWYAQGLIYGVRSHIKINTQESGGSSAGLFGQVKGYEVSFYGDNKGLTYDCPIEEGSLLNYVKAANASVAVVKLQYYLY